MDDSYTQTIFGLNRKRRELLASISETQEALSRHQSALDAIEAALLVFDPTAKLASEIKRRGAGVDGLYRFIAERMRKEGSVTSLGVAGALMRARGWDARDKTLATHVRKRCGDALQKMRRQGKVTGEREGVTNDLTWRLVS